MDNDPDVGGSSAWRPVEVPPPVLPRLVNRPERLGRYQVLGTLGRGAMGVVYKAHDPILDRTVALKVVSPIAGDDAHAAEYLERFRREARAAASLSHPNIVSVYDLDVDEATGCPFIVMERVDGVTLGTVLAENPRVPVPQAVEILTQISAALSEAHRHGVIHRDIKPSNIFLDTHGRAKLGDFGIARIEGSDLTDAGIGLGTPGYVAPEVASGAPADACSDVFALGVMGYQLLAGRRPFFGVTREAAATGIADPEPRPPSALRPEVPEHVSAAVMRALAKSPSDRTASALAFLQELQGAAVPVAPPRTVVARGRSARLWGGAAAALLVPLALGAVLGQSGGAPAVEAAAPRNTDRRTVTMERVTRVSTPATSTVVRRPVVAQKPENERERRPERAYDTQPRREPTYERDRRREPENDVLAKVAEEAWRRGREAALRAGRGDDDDDSDEKKEKKRRRRGGRDHDN